MTNIRKLRIAGCYIVRNEEKVLEKSLKSIDGLVDDILVVDTGSTDKTIEIARAHGARVISHVWKDDFAEARNFALNQLHADWVVFLDADEYFTDETRCNLREEICKADAAGTDLLLLQWRNIDADTGAHLVDVYTPRIFRLKSSLRYVGRIHEQLRETGELIEHTGIVPEERLLLIHTGYSSHLSKEKAKRNLDLLLEDMKENPHPEELYMAIAEAYDGLDDEESALKYAYMDIANGRQSSTYASRSYRILMRRLAKNMSAYEERQEVVRRAAAEFPELPEFHAEYAECLAYVFDYEGAIHEAEMALSAFAGYQSLEPLQFDAEMCEIVKGRIKLWKTIIEKEKTIKISSCLIARDEEKDIPLWLENTAKYSDERIVLDTGSTDRTAELARSAGAKVFDFQWQEDFAAAKNAALSHAEGNWIVFPDADETMEQPQRVRRFLAETEVLQPEAEAVRIYIRNIDEDDGNREIQRFMNIRLFRGNAGLCYNGRIHENLVHEDGSLPATRDEKYRLTVCHTGYSSGRMMAKTQRNLAILEQDILENGEGPQHYRYLADIYSTLGAPEKALHYARLAKASPVQGLGSSSDMNYLELQCLRWLDRPLKERLAAAVEAIERFPKQPEFYVLAVEILLELGEYDAAKQLLETALTLSNAGEVSGEASHFHGMQTLVARCKAALCLQSGNMDMAGTFIAEALHGNSYDEIALNLFCEVYAKESPKELAIRLCAFFDKDENALRYLLRWAEHSGRIRLYLEFSRLFVAVGGTQPVRTKLYEKVSERGISETCDDIVKGLADSFPQLVMSLLLLEKQDGIEAQQLSKHCFELLPQEAAAVWEAYLGQQVEFFEDGFNVVFPVVLQFGDDEQLIRMGELALGFSSEKLYDIAQTVMDEERWIPAFELLSRIPGDSSVVDAVFWTKTGICLYHLKEWASAEECFTRAEDMDGVSSEITAYRVWMKEETERG